MLSRRRNSRQPFRWISALTFNITLLILGYVISLLIVENRTALGEEYVASSEAVSATRDEMSKLFSKLVPASAEPRNFWAGQIDSQLREDDLITTRGLLMAAPDMLDRKDAGAVLAAANTETAGRLDERLLSAATLFLPDDVRARYERQTAPDQVESLSINTSLPTTSAAEGTDVSPSGDDDTSATASPRSPTAGTRFDPAQNAFNVLGSERDLAYQSAGWLRGDRTDVFSLSLSGLGLAAMQGKFPNVELSDDILRGASLVKSARRAGRLQPQFADLLESRLERAIPEQALRTELDATFNSGGSIFIEGDAILDAFVRAADEDWLAPLFEDLERIAHLAEGRPNSAGLTILETVSSYRDLKRAELITIAGGDRAVALAEYYGQDSLEAAQTVMDWTMKLVLLIMVMVALIVFLGWLAFSTFSQSMGRKDSYSRSFSY